MELTYTDSDLVDIGILKEANSDFAFGSDENNFEILTTKRNANLIVGGYCYYENTEYGGRIDSVKASNNNEDIKYNGRTWHGILNSFIMTYDSEYLSYNGDQYTTIDGTLATDLITDLISKTGLSFIEVDTSFDGTLEIVSADARMGMYDFICSILKQNNMKMYFRCNKDGVVLYVSGVAHFDEEFGFDNKQMSLTASKSRKFTNHFVLHNYDEENNIHRKLDLYTDESGNIQPYASVDNPLRDSDYIYTDENKVISGPDEIVSLIDGTSKVENYRLEDANISKLDWRRQYPNYYEYVLKENSEDEYEYKQLKATDEYVRLTSEPASWNYEWNRFYKKVNDSYTQLSEEDNTANTRISWVALTQNAYLPPVLQEDVNIIDARHWQTYWENYFTRTWDGNQWIYSQAEGRPDYEFKKLSSAPTGWSTSDGRSDLYVDDTLTTYTVKIYQPWKGGKKYKQTITFTNFNYKKYKAHKSAGDKGKTLLSICKKMNKFYAYGSSYYKMTNKVVNNSKVTIETYEKRRGKGVMSFKWGDRKVYRRVEKEKKLPPIWVEPNDSHSNPKGFFMKKTSTVGVPSFNYLTTTLGYQIYAQYDAIPTYERNKFYLKVVDHFATQIEKAKEELAKELDKLDEASAELNIETYDFDVGDLLGGLNPLTKEKFSSSVTKKIAKINSFGSSVSYEIG